MFKKLTILALAVLASACSLDEPTKECGKVVVVVKPAFPTPEGEENPFEEVKGISVYVFDNNTGLLTDILMMDDAAVRAGQLEVNTLVEGNYTFVAWGGTRETMNLDGFKTIQMEDAARSTYKDAQIGVTTKNDFFVMIDTESASGDTGIITPSGDFTDLYYAVSENVNISKATDAKVDFSFVRNTNIINVNVTGIEHLGSRAGGEPPLNIYIQGKNGRYNWANSIDADARVVHYTSEVTELISNKMSTRSKILRLELNRHVSDPVYLYIDDPSKPEGQQSLRRFDILKLIADEANMSPAELSQTFLDRQYTFTINLSLDVNLNVNVELVNWDIVNPEPIL